VLARSSLWARTIIIGLEENLSTGSRSNIEYLAYDINQEYARETRRLAERPGFASFAIKIGNLADFSRIVAQGPLFDFITLTNTVREAEPSRLAAIMVDRIPRRSETQLLLVYDMEQIRP
jgi:hypothetical protein